MSSGVLQRLRLQAADSSVIAFRHERLLHDAPPALFALALTMALLDLASMPFDFQTDAGAIIYLLMAANMAGVAWYLSRPARRARTAVPAMAYVATCNVIASLSYVHQDSRQLVLVYGLFIMLVSPAFVMSYRAMAVLTPLWLGFVGITLVRSPEMMAGQVTVHWMIATVMAQTMGLLIMFLRIQALDEIGRLTLLTRSMATHDNLTGVLNRHGLEERIERVVARAARDGGSVYACFVDVDGLKSANDVHGHEFGDEVLTTVARAVRATAPEGALIARWGGDEFLAIGAGNPPDIDAWTAQLTQHIAASGIDRNKWAGTVSLGVAGVEAGQCQIDHLITSADTHMYDRRRAIRGR